VERIAQECGFSTGAALRFHFGRTVGVSPTDYRKTFKQDMECRPA
jgi:transcriptional regulator GlxA family with amidase domain